MKKPKCLRTLRNDPRVTSVEDEGPDGWWVYLADGYINGEGETTMLHEYTVRDLIQAFTFVREMTFEEKKRSGVFLDVAS